MDDSAENHLRYSGSPKKDVELIRVLDLLPLDSFSVELIAFLLDQPVEQANEELTRLAAGHLLEKCDSCRFRYREEIASPAPHSGESTTTSALSQDLLRRTVDFFVLGAAATDYAIAGPHRLRLVQHDLTQWPIPFSDEGAALAWLEAERANFLAVIGCANKNGWFAQSWQLCESLWIFYHSRKYYAEWIESHKLGVHAASISGNSAAATRMHNQLARAYLEIDQLDSAEYELASAMIAARNCGMSELEAVVFESKGLLEFKLNRFEVAIAFFHQAREIWQERGESRGEALQCYHLGQIHLAAGEIEVAAQELETALRLANEQSDDYVAARAMIELARAYQALGEYDRGRALAEKAAVLSRRIGQPAKEIRAISILENIERESAMSGAIKR